MGVPYCREITTLEPFPQRPTRITSSQKGFCYMADLSSGSKSERSDGLSESPSIVAVSSELDLKGEVNAERSDQICQYLRKNANLKDALIVVSGTEIPVHRVVVASLSSFFSTAFCGAFSESENKKLVLHDASLEAVNVILEFAYGLDVKTRLKDLNLALDVWQLAHRYQISALRAKAADIALQSTNTVGFGSQWVAILKHAKLYGSPSEEAAAKKALASNFVFWSFSLDFGELPFNDLLDTIVSRELIAEEHDKFGALLRWTEENSDWSEENLLKLFPHIHFERFKKEIFSIALSKSTELPKAVLVDLLKRSLPSGTMTNGFFETSRVRNSNLETLGWPIHFEGTRTEFVFTAKKDSPGDDFYFSFNHWAMSANAEWTDDSLTLVLSFDHRLRRADRSDSNLFDDVSKYDFKVLVRKAATKFGDSERLFDKLQLSKNSFRLKLNWEVHGQKFSELWRATDLAQINIWVYIRCRKV